MANTAGARNSRLPFCLLRSAVLLDGESVSLAVDMQRRGVPDRVLH